MCNCGGVRAVQSRSPGQPATPVLPSGGQVQTWFYMPSLVEGAYYVTYGPVTGRALYFSHNGINNIQGVDAEWMITNPDWPRGKPVDAILARRGSEYTLYRPDTNGSVSGAANYVFSAGVEQPVLNEDLSAVQAAVSGTIL